MIRIAISCDKLIFSPAKDLMQESSLLEQVVSFRQMLPTQM